jgi:hypothetical protein
VGLLLLAAYYGLGLDNRLQALTSSSSEGVVKHFKDEGLEAGDYYDVDDEKGPPSPVPRTYRDGTRFTIPSMGRDTSGEPKGGRLFTFDSQEDLEPV